MNQHPIAPVPTALFDDPDRERRWRRRFSAPRTSLPGWARDRPDRANYLSTATGRYEVWCWDLAADAGTAPNAQPTSTTAHTVATDRPDGTTGATLSADGTTLWWFDDTDGDEFGCWRVQPFGGVPADGAEVALPGVDPGYQAGIEVGDRTVLVGFGDDDGTRIHLRHGNADPEVVYRHAQDGGVGGLSTDETIWLLVHSEQGDSRYPSLRALSVHTGEVIAELSDGPAKGLAPIAFSPVSGDQRILVGHERRGRDELLIWNPVTGEVTELPIDLPGDLDGDFTPDAQGVLVVHRHAGRTTVHRYDLGSGLLTGLPVAPGVVSGASVRPDGDLWYRWSSAAAPGQVRVLHPCGADELLLRPGGEPSPGSAPAVDVWVDGPGGRIHALLGVPDPRLLSAGPGPGRQHNPWPTIFAVHGGPADGDDDSFDAARAAWLDAGFAVVQVNYRGSTGYGSAWRDALTARIGHTELADIAAVHDHLIGTGLVDPAASVIAGYSWGGFLALLAAGTQPDRWAVVVGGVPVADYPASYEDEMEQLRAYDRALFGGSPQEVPDKYRDSSPLTYVDQVRAPVLVLAGENDPRCPIRQIENYLAKLHDGDRSYAVYRYDAGHGSMVIRERMRQVSCEIAFVRTALGLQ